MDSPETSLGGLPGGTLFRVTDLGACVCGRCRHEPPGVSRSDYVAYRGGGALRHDSAAQGQWCGSGKASLLTMKKPVADLSFELLLGGVDVGGHELGCAFGIARGDRFRDGDVLASRDLQ